MNLMEHGELRCTPPCSMHSVLLEKRLTDLSGQKCEFELDEKLRQEKCENMNFCGPDAICDIYLNERFLAHTENMHCK